MSMNCTSCVQHDIFLEIWYHGCQLVMMVPTTTCFKILQHIHVKEISLQWSWIIFKTLSYIWRGMCSSPISGHFTSIKWILINNVKNGWHFVSVHWGVVLTHMVQMLLISRLLHVIPLIVTNVFVCLPWLDKLYLFHVEVVMSDVSKPNRELLQRSDHGFSCLFSCTARYFI